MARFKRRRYSRPSAPVSSARRPFRLPGNPLLLLACLPVLIYLLLPTLIIVPMALTKGQLIQFPPIWISVHSFADYFDDRQWIVRRSSPSRLPPWRSALPVSPAPPR